MVQISDEQKCSSVILGAFTFADGRQRESQLLHVLAHSGTSAKAMTVAPGFSQCHLGQNIQAERAVIFMRCLFPAKSRRHWPRPRPFKLRRLASLIRNSDRVVILADHPFRSLSGLAQTVASSLLKCMFPRRVRLLRASVPTQTILRHLDLPRVAPPPARTASEWAFSRLLNHNPDGLPIRAGHVSAALRHAQAPHALVRELANLQCHAEKLDRAAIEDALRQIQLIKDHRTSRAVRNALGHAEGAQSGNRLLYHMRLTGHVGGQLRPYLQRDAEPAAKTTRETSAFISFLRTGMCKSPGDAEWLSAMFAPNESSLTRFEWLLVLILRMPMASSIDFREPWAGKSWRGRVHRIIPGDHPGTRNTAWAPPQVTLHGLPMSQSGLGQNMRMSHDALHRAGIPVDFAQSPTAGFTPLMPRIHARSLTHPIAVHHLNADRIPQEIFAHYRYQSAYQIGFLLWELDQLPKAHALAMDMLDEIWVPSVYLLNLYQQHFRKNVVFMRKGLPFLAPAAVPKPDGITRFVVAFDANSSVVRKNPIAVLRAFQAAFPGQNDVELIIKATPVAANHWGDPGHEMQAIKHAAEGDNRIRVITQVWPFNKLLGLIESADCVVSAHRSEGFGYIPAFAMKLGRPVIVTDYSGTRDFCTDETAFPVAYDLCDVRDGQSIFPTPGAQWAQIDVEALVKTMQRVYEFPEKALARAAVGQQRINGEYSIAQQGARYARRLDELGFLTPEVTKPTATLDVMFAKCS